MKLLPFYALILQVILFLKINSVLSFKIKSNYLRPSAVKAACTAGRLAMRSK